MHQDPEKRITLQLKAALPLQEVCCPLHGWDAANSDLAGQPDVHTQAHGHDIHSHLSFSTTA